MSSQVRICWVFFKSFGYTFFLKKRKGVVCFLGVAYFLRVRRVHKITTAMIAIAAPTMYHSYGGFSTTGTSGAANTAISVFAYEP